MVMRILDTEEWNERYARYSAAFDTAAALVAKWEGR